MTPAASAISSGGASGRNSSAPAVDAQQRHPVGEHVVHLAGDPPALGLAGLGDLEPLLGLQPLGPLPERVHELPARAHEQPPADGDRGERLAQHEVGAVAGCGRVDQREDGGGHHGHGGGRHHAAARRAGGRAEGRQQRGPGSGRGDDRREQRADRDRGRSRAPRPQGQPRGHAEHEVERQSGLGVLRLGLRQRDQADPGGGDRQERVDRPVARGARGGASLDQVARQQGPLPPRHARLLGGRGRHRHRPQA